MKIGSRASKSRQAHITLFSLYLNWRCTGKEQSEVDRICQLFDSFATGVAVATSFSLSTKFFFDRVSFLQKTG
jgi:hypothetical protein